MLVLTTRSLYIEISFVGVSYVYYVLYNEVIVTIFYLWTNLKGHDKIF